MTTTQKQEEDSIKKFPLQREEAFHRLSQRKNRRIHCVL